MEASGLCFLGVTELPSFPLLQGEWIYISWQLHRFERFLLHAYSIHFLRNTSVMYVLGSRSARECRWFGRSPYHLPANNKPLLFLSHGE